MRSLQILFSYKCLSDQRLIEKHLHFLKYFSKNKSFVTIFVITDFHGFVEPSTVGFIEAEKARLRYFSFIENQSA